MIKAAQSKESKIDRQKKSKKTKGTSRATPKEAKKIPKRGT